MAVEQYLLAYDGFAAEKGVCHVLLERQGPAPIVLVGSPSDNPGTSVTNALEEVAQRIAMTLLGGQMEFRLYQFEPKGLPRLRPTFYRVDWASEGFKLPQWIPVSAEAEPGLSELARLLPNPSEYDMRHLHANPEVADASQKPRPGAPPSPLTVAELFPADDPLAQWVFSLTALAEDLAGATELGQQALEDEVDLRRGFSYLRTLATRLYEAKRLVAVVDAQPEVSSFVKRMDAASNPWWAFLRGVYEPRNGHADSMVDDLYALVRHAAIHYSWVGSKELQQRLRDAGRLPARIIVKPDARRVEYQWVQAVSGWGLFDPGKGPRFYEEYRQRYELAGQIAAAWMMLTSVLVLLYARDRGISPAQLGEMPAGFRLP